MSLQQTTEHSYLIQILISHTYNISSSEDIAWHILDVISGLQTARPLQKIHRQTEEHQNIAHTRSPS